MKIVIFLVAVPLVFSCTSRNHSEVFGQLTSSIISSNKLISSLTQIEYNELENNLHDPVTVERATKWEPKSKLIQKMTTSLLKEIDSMKANFVNTKDKSKQILLFEKLNNFRSTILSLDTSIDRSFSKDKNFIQSSKDDFLDSIFLGKEKEEQILLLSTLQNKIVILENSVITFCKLQTAPSCTLRFDKTSVLVGQNTNHLKSGEILEINAGVGAFSTVANPVIIINDNAIPVMNGVANFKLRAVDKIGKHLIPVKIEYLDEIGRKISQNVDIEYYVDQ